MKTNCHSRKFLSGIKSWCDPRLKISGMTVLSLLIFTYSAFSATTDHDKSRALGELKARAFPSVIHVGDEVRLAIQVRFPKGFSIEPLSSKKLNFAPFELRGIDKPLIVQQGNEILQTVMVRLTIFEVGDFNIPSIPVTVWNVAAQNAEAHTPPIPVHVVSIGKTKDDKPDIRPIKGPITVSLRYLWDWFFGAAALFLSALLVFKIYRRHKKRMEDLESLLPPHQRLARELERLNENGWLSLGREKEHYTGLSDILRRYLERRYGLELMEHTTAEIMTFLKEKNFEEEIFGQIREVLEKTDLVKFARFMPERALAADLENRLRHIAEQTKPVAEVPVQAAKGKKP